MTEMVQTAEKPQKIRSLSVWLCALLTLCALVAAWVMKNSVENRLLLVEQRGVSAYVPQGWKISRGIAEGSLVFSAKDIFASYHAYNVHLEPISADMTEKDVVFMLNLTRSGVSDAYRVLNQEAIKINGKDAYQVNYAYVNAKDMTEAPIVIEGLNTIFLEGDQALVAGIEAKAEDFSAAMADYDRFIRSITYVKGGSK